MSSVELRNVVERIVYIIASLLFPHEPLCHMPLALMTSAHSTFSDKTSVIDVIHFLATSTMHSLY